MQTVSNEAAAIFFLDAPGGTGKAILARLILALIRSQNDIALTPLFVIRWKNCQFRFEIIIEHAIH